ncbi:uncharacterized protein M6B38_140175 [Iris pallida]|uniref:hAT-like transposase RNase-H fold domain-containing protein n=1 Tax=Iris pallida TaxID=29817 RepID=A0AAX6FDB0_IRIPA|nr:Uncharacterized protein M6B38_237230 [Iris pallida]KAJ6814158.1 uncharacterized protein M6B38_140175 [Iris pallida]
MDHVFEMVSACRDSCRHEWLKSVADDMAQRARSFSIQVYNLFTFMAAILDPRIKKELIPENLNSEKYLGEQEAILPEITQQPSFPPSPMAMDLGMMRRLIWCHSQKR